MGASVPMARYEALCPAFNAAMIEAGCTTVNRAAMWCAQLGHESGGLRWMEEIGSGTAYEGRSDLGNIYAGDGVRYKGRGPIQITGRTNYTAVSRWAYDQGLVPTPTYFVGNPTQLASDRYGFIGPVWYWTVARPGINSMCDAQDLVGVTRAINGGTNGLDDRRTRWQRCLALGPALLPEEEFLMALTDDQQQTVWKGSAQLAGQTANVRKAPDWLARFLPPSFRDPKGAWPRDEIDAITNEVVTGVFTFDPDDTIDFGDGPVRLVDVPPTQPVNQNTLLRIIAAKQVAAERGAKST
ncbi:MAG: hypothetical protein QM662_05360 [Gordonia sp. (in: high G+C Gram-positive bacteria)]